MHKFDLAAILTIIVGIGSLATEATFSQQLADAFGPSAKVILSIVGLLSTVASVVLRVYSNPSPPAGTQMVVTTSTSVPPKVASLTTPSAAAGKDTPA